MIRLFKTAKLVGLTVFVLTFAGCDSADERAEQYYQSGLKFVASGEIDKALIEFRNVFKLNGEHLEARLEYARLLMERNDFDQATSQYLRVLEQEPSNRVARLAVGMAMLRFQNFPEASKHADVLLAANPADMDALAIRGSAYVRTGRVADAVTIANGLLATDPTNVAAMLILISSDVLNMKLDLALARATDAVSLAPDEFSVYLAKLAVLEKLKKNDEISELLKQMAGRFPDNEEITQTRIKWMLEIGDLTEAEQLLRELSEKEPDNTEAALNVVGLVESVRGLDAARVELEKLAEKGGPKQNAFRRALAVMTYRQGDAETAAASVRELVRTAPNETDRDESNVLLAFILYEDGKKDEALQIIETVLEGDEKNVAALKVRGQIRIDLDMYEQAISDLRAAQEADPTDASVLVLQATAYQLNGNHELARERLAEAVSISGGLPEIAIEYARMLTQDGKLDIAEIVLIDSSQRYQKSRDVLIALANVRVALKDWTGAEETAEKLRVLAGDRKDSVAENITIAVLQGQDKIEQSIGLLEQMLASGDTEQTEATMVNIVRTHIDNGEIDIAETFLNNFLATNPNDFAANLLLGGLKTVAGQLEVAEEIYRKTIVDHPTKSGGYMLLARLLATQNRFEESQEVLGVGLEKSEDNSELQFIQATYLEADGDFEGAIEIYSRLYQQTPASDLLANNLASLLSEHRIDEASLDKAYTVSKRLRDSEFAPYQDTYGWILYLRGEYEKALAVLVLAQPSLGENPIFLYHLGMTQARLNHKAEAIQLLKAAISSAENAASDLPQIKIAKTELVKLESVSAN